MDFNHYQQIFSEADPAFRQEFSQLQEEAKTMIRRKKHIDEEKIAI